MQARIKSLSCYKCQFGRSDSGALSSGCWLSYNHFFLGAKLWLAGNEIAGHVHSQLFEALEIGRLQLVLFMLHFQFSLQLTGR